MRFTSLRESPDLVKWGSMEAALEWMVLRGDQMSPVGHKKESRAQDQF